jgi:hypothetical protein
MHAGAATAAAVVDCVVTQPGSIQAEPNAAISTNK